MRNLIISIAILLLTVAGAEAAATSVSSLQIKPVDSNDSPVINILAMGSDDNDTVSVFKIDLEGRIKGILRKFRILG